MNHASLPRGIAIVLGTLAALSASNAQDARFGDPDSIEYADALWDALTNAQLVGDDAIRSSAYEGNEPHGLILEQTETKLTVAGRRDAVIVKHNYMRPDDPLSTNDVMNSGWSTNLVAVTVMFRRESGYNPDAGNWFWAKFLPDGSLDRAPQGMPLAGRVPGCIQCHADAPGGDQVFLHDRYRSD
jgi:hypothetical protein